MSCPRTQHLLQEYFADDLAPLARDELDKHLRSCADCNSELEKLILAQRQLQRWRDQKVPHWDRGLALFKREHKPAGGASGFWNHWQWFPTAASFVMLCLMLLNVTVVSTGSGFSVSFGNASTAELQSQLAGFREERRQEQQQFAARMEQRQDNNNVQLMQAVLEQTQQATAENFDQIYAYFEQQRLRDLQDMRTSYQQLVDSDYETIRSLEQLASFVSYQGEVR